MFRFKANHVPGRITRPRLTSDVLIETAIAIRDDIEAGGFLITKITSQGVGVLLSIPVVGHGIEERLGSQIFDVPAGPRQRAGNSSGQYFARSRFQHDDFSRY